MSLPVYEAISFQKILDRGGHSKPWLVLVDMKGSPHPYVVKLYKTVDIEARNKMTAEVLGNVLTPKLRTQLICSVKGGKQYSAILSNTLKCNKINCIYSV